MVKQFVRRAIQAVAGIAFVVFLFAPVSTAHQMILFVISIPVLLVCLFFWLLLFGDEHSGYWPRES